MFMQREQDARKLDEDFGFSVESIMRCEDFKSNFARRLSNRYISRPPVASPRQELTLRPVTCSEESPKLARERIEPVSQLFQPAATVEQNSEVVKPPDKQVKNPTTQNTEKAGSEKKCEMQRTEVTALNMEVETLRWQLTQTEGNRQMHIALLKQIVTFLNRVKDHIEKNDDKKRDSLDSINSNDLPRARSYLYMNKNIREEYSLSSPKKNTRKISKSISNVNGYKDISGLWRQSKLSLAPENETGTKINEEITRLINLANTVLSTKIPDLACSCIENVNDINTVKLTESNKETNNNDSMISLNLIDDPPNISIIDINIDDVTTIDSPKINDYNGSSKTDSITDSDIFDNCTLVDDLVALDSKDKHYKVKKRSQSFNSPKVTVDKKNQYNVMNLFEDESGFSSMSSFQEIGIPIISIIPPSPCKDIGYSDELPLLGESEKTWKSDALDLDKQAMKVFWV